jgi:antirestriction protein ArdC
MSDAIGRAGPKLGREITDPVVDVKSQVARTLIEAMEKGETPWQKPWSSASLRPTNATSLKGYRGVNRILLSLARSTDGSLYGDNRWVTYRQAQSKGWQVRGGEKGTMIVKVIEIDPAKDRERSGDGGGATGRGGDKMPAKPGTPEESRRKPVTLRRYFVFNAEQIDGMPPLEKSSDLEFDPIARAEAVIDALKEKTNLVIVHGGNQACYVPATDQIRLPPKKKFKSAYDLYSVTGHEICHGTMAPHRLNRTEAYAKRWGDEAYALEELTAEIGSAILSAELGIAERVSPEQREKHIANHAGYLQSWLKVLSKDPLAIFTAAKAADRVSEYVLGFEREMAAMDEHAEWIAEYDAAPRP